MFYRMALWLLAVSFVTIGCDSGTYTPESQSVTPKNSDLKALIDGIAASGSIGSASMDLRTQHDALKTADAAKADSIQADLDALIAAEGDPAKVKKLAAELSKKL